LYIVGGGPDEEKQQEDAEELKKRIMQVQEACKFSDKYIRTAGSGSLFSLRNFSILFTLADDNRTVHLI
jgi:hypothetical protein